MKKKVEDLTNRCNFLQKSNEALEMRIHNIEQAEKNKNLVVVGVEHKADEKLSDVLGIIANKLDVEAKQIDRAWRIPTNKKLRNNEDKNDPQIIIKFKSIEARDDWWERRRRIRNNKDIYANGKNTPIFINEDLTKFNKELLWNAKQKLKSHYKYIWVKHGRIFCRKDDEEKKYPILP